MKLILKDGRVIELKKSVYQLGIKRGFLHRWKVFLGFLAVVSVSVIFLVLVLVSILFLTNLEP